MGKAKSKAKSVQNKATKKTPSTKSTTPLFDPNAKSCSDGIFGLPFSEDNARVIYRPVPWDVTTSYGYGTHLGPKAIKTASAQQDLFDLDYVDPFAVGLWMAPIDKKILSLNSKTRKLAQKIIDASDEEVAKSKSLQKVLEQVNMSCQEMNDWVYQQTKNDLEQNKYSIIVGGDHSTPFGAIKAYAERYPKMGILHFDAHSDTRKSYMGFEYSHASIMRNCLEQIPQLKSLVQVGIRDLCEQEFVYTKFDPRVRVYYDRHVQLRKNKGEAFAAIAHEIVEQLPKEIYISFDIDGLDPKYCPHTGTPVPGGLEWHEIQSILKAIQNQGKKIVGFDLVEVAPHPDQKQKDEWDANVGMRLLYLLTTAMLATQGHLLERE